MIAVLLLAACAAVQRTKPILTTAYSSEVLPSGLRLVVEPARGTGHVEVVLVLGAGWADDPEGQEGLAHLVEHLAFSVPDADGLTHVDRLERFGAVRWSARTGDSTVRYAATAPRAVLAELVAEQTRVLLDPLGGLTADLLAREKSVVRTEAISSEYREVYALLTGQVFAPTLPAAHTRIRSELNVTDVPAEAVKRFIAERHRPANATLVVIGDFERAAARTDVWKALPEPLRAPGPPRPAVAREVPLPDLPVQRTVPTAAASFEGEQLLFGFVVARDSVPLWAVEWVRAALATEPALGAVDLAENDGVLFVYGRVPRDFGVSAPDQLAALGAQAERTVAAHVRSFRPHPSQWAAFDDWETRAEERGIAAQLRGDARLPLERLTDRFDPVALPAHIRDAFSAWRIRGVVGKHQAPVIAALPPAAPPRAVHEAAVPLARAAQIAAVPDVPLESRRLGNGLTVVVVPRPGARSVSVALVRPGGVSRGTPAAWQLAEWAMVPENRCGGAATGARLEETTTALVTSGDVRQLGCLVARAAEWATAPITADAFAREQRKAVGAAPDTTDDVQSRLDAKFTAHIRPTVAELKAVTHDAAEAYRKAVSDPHRAALVVVGDVDPAQVFTVADEKLGPWVAGDAPPVAVHAPLPPRAVPLHVFFEGGSASDIRAFLSCALPAQSASLALLRAVMDRRLWLFRQRFGATYVLGSGQRLAASSNVLTVGVGVHPDRLAPLLTELRATLTAAPSTAELDRARWIAAHQLRLRQAGAAAEVGPWLGDQLVTGIPVEKLRAANARSVQVPEAEVQAAFASCLGAQLWSLYGPSAVTRPVAVTEFGEEAVK